MDATGIESYHGHNGGPRRGNGQGRAGYRSENVDMTEHHVCLYKVNQELRQCRFYSLSVQPNLFGKWSLIREWGRIGGAGREKIDWHATELDARRVMFRKAHEKRRRGYRP